jgi:hypothetical protein
MGVDKDSWLRFVVNHGEVALRFAAYLCYSMYEVYSLGAELLIHYYTIASSLSIRRY